MSYTATYTKLRSGEWGLRVVGDKPRVGQPIHVEKKDGTVKTESISEIVWSEGETHLCSLDRGRD